MIIMNLDIPPLHPKCAHTGIIACFKCQVKNYPKIANYENIPKYKTSKSKISKACRENSENVPDIMIQTSLF